MPVKLNGSTSGSVTIDAPAVAGTNTLTLPAVTDTLVGLAATQTLTNKTIQGGAITSATAQASTSGTSIDFTSIPSWVKRITVMFSGVSTNGTSFIQLQLGDSGGVETTGYISGAWGANTNNTNSTTGLVIQAQGSATYNYHGNMIVTLIDSSTNTWAFSSVMSSSVAALNSMGGGSKSLSATLTQVRITTVGGTDTFDAGTINILYE